MKRPKKIQLPADKLAVWVSTPALALLGGALLAMYFFTGCYLLLPAALMQFLGTAAQLFLLLPVCKSPPAPLPVPEELPEALPEEGKKKPRRKKKAAYWAKRLLYRLHSFYFRRRSALIAVCIGLSALALHLVFWKVQPGQTESINFLLPVILAVLFVLSLVLEKWCGYAMKEDNTYTQAQLKGLISALSMGRITYILVAATMVLRLLNIFDAELIVRILLSVLFVYETLLLAFSLAVRVIRKEMNTSPELIVSIRGMGKDMNILTYLEENTGITMRSLWSLQLMKRTLPAALLGLALVLWLSTGVVQIEAYQQGALYRLGELRTEVLQPGIHLTLPWPLDRVVIQDTATVKQAAIGYVPSEKQDNIWTEDHGGEEYNLLLGGGKEIVAINLLVEYRIDDLVEYLKNSAAPEQLLQAKAYEIITAHTISTDLDTLLAADREVFSETFRQELTDQLAACNTGLQIVNVVLESVHPPVDIAQVYQDIISAGIEAQYLILEAENSANYTVYAAEQEVISAIGKAEKEQHERIGEARSAVTEFMAAAAANEAYPQQYRYYKYLTALTKAYSGTKLVIVGEGVDTGSLYIGSLGSTVQAQPDANTSTGTTNPEMDEDYDYADPIE